MTNKIRAKNTQRTKQPKPTSILESNTNSSGSSSNNTGTSTSTKSRYGRKSHATKHMLICLILAAIYAFAMKVKIMERMSITENNYAIETTPVKICLERKETTNSYCFMANILSRKKRRRKKTEKEL